MEDQIITALKNSPKNNLIYLIEKLSEDAGFFTSEGKLLYVVTNLEFQKESSIETEFLKVSTNIYISSVKNFAQFPSGYYNIIYFRGNEEEEFIYTFIRICRIHNLNMSEIGFWDFFYSLSALFQPSHEQKELNLIGFWGELALIKTAYEKWRINISTYWHTKGPYSKYDFTFPKFNLEIKSVINALPIIKIKHEQLFNKDFNYIGSVCMEECEQGESVADLVDYFHSNQDFASIGFQINIEHELRRISTIKMHTEKFKIINLSFYNTRDINCIPSLPYMITNVRYTYDLSSFDPIDMETILHEVEMK